MVPFQEVELGLDVTVRTALDQASAGIDSVSDPLVAAELRLVFGRIYNNIGHGVAAAENLRRSRELQEGMAERDAELWLATLTALAEAEHLLGNYDAAVAITRDEVLPAYELPELAGSAAHSEALAAWASLLRDLDQLDAALEAQQRAVSMLEALRPDDDLDLIRQRSNLAGLHQVRGEDQQAIVLLEPALQAMLAMEPAPEAMLARVAADLGSSLNRLGYLPEAEQLLREALIMRVRILDPGHPSLGHGHVSLGVLLYRMGRFTDAVDELAAAAAIYRSSLGGSHAYLPPTLVSLGAALTQCERHADAVQALREALGILQDAGRGDHTDAINARSHLGEALIRSGSWDEGLAELRAAVAQLDGREDLINPALAGGVRERLTNWEAAAGG